MLHSVHVTRQPPMSGLDAKGREWGSNEHWYFHCDTCGLCGPPRKSKDVADAEAALHERSA